MGSIVAQERNDKVKTVNSSRISFGSRRAMLDPQLDLNLMLSKAKEFEDEGGGIGLVMADALVRGMRDIGYKNTAYALFELVDNSIQAGAQKVCIELLSERGKTEIEKIVVADDAHGMPKQWLPFAIRWGGTHREKDRSGFGRYGYGMKSASVSLARRVELTSKTENEQNWSSIYLDLEEISQGKFRDKNGNLITPEPTEGPIAKLVAEVIERQFGRLEHGTIVVISKIDNERLTYSKVPKLKEFLLQQIGVTYRNYLRAVDILVDGTKVEPIDPLFITPGFKFFDEDDDRAEPLPPLVLDVKSADRKEVLGAMRIRFSFMAPTFLRVPEDKDKVDGRGAKNNSRFKIRKEHNGIIFLRAGRQIDVVDSKCPWFGFQKNDRYLGIEVDFDPILDEEFKITTSKQQVVPTDRIWDILAENGVQDAISSMRTRWDKENKSHSKEVEDSAIIGGQNARPSEEAMKLAEKFFPPLPEAITTTLFKKAEELLVKEAEKKEKETGVPSASIKQQLQIEASTRPYKAFFIDSPTSTFFYVQQIGGQKRLFINKAHRFYTEVYASPLTTVHMRYALEALLFVLGCGEVTSNPEIQLFYEGERTRWSIMLSAALAQLEKWDGTSDSEQVELESIEERPVGKKES